jgi:hypothetical protein
MRTGRIVSLQGETVTKRAWGSGFAVFLACAGLFFAAGCSRQQSDWEKARTANNIESYEQFVKKYPTGEFTSQAQARVKELEEERDWQKARDADTPDAYQAFLKQYPEGKWTEEARIRIENFSLAAVPAGSGSSPEAASAASAASTGPAASAEKPKAAAKHEPAAKSDKAASGSAPGKYAVQLAAYTSGKAAAEHGWSSLQKSNPTLLKGVSHRVAVGKNAKGGTVYRLQATGLSKSHAESLCAKLKSKSKSCIVLPPGKT